MDEAHPSRFLREFRPFSVFQFLRTQLYDGDGFAAALAGLEGVGSNKRMGFEEVSEAAAKGAGPVAVDDANGRKVRERGVIQKFVHELRGLLDGQADDADFARGGFSTRDGPDARGFGSKRRGEIAAGARRRG